MNLLERERYNIENINDIINLSIICISKIWDIHPFVGGNTRTATVFTLKFLKSLGIENISNDLFRDNSKYFRNCLVLNNYSELNKYNEFIRPNSKPLHRFFEKMLLNDELELLKIAPVHNNKYYQKLENSSKLAKYEGLNEDLDID